MLKVLDLFSGIGGFSLGLERTGGFETVAFCEIEEFPRRVLAKHWPEIFIHDDVKTLTKESLCKGYAKNALLNQLCKEMGGNIASVKRVIIHTKKPSGKETLQSIMSGPQNAVEALSIITAENVLAAENPNTRFWQLTTSLITVAKNGEPIKAQCGNSLSSADILTIIKFFVTTATWQNPSTVPAHINEMLGINEDVRTLTADRLAADGIAVDVICGGFPCQDLSQAGLGTGIDGERSGLWCEFARLIREIRPKFAVVENVPRLLTGARGGWFARVLGDLAAIGYDAQWDCIQAGNLGAAHIRDRLWVTAYVSDAAQGGLIECWREQFEKNRASPGDVYSFRREPVPARMAYGVPNRLDRTGACGNAVVPQIPELIGRAILASMASAPVTFDDRVHGSVDSNAR